ncbi:MAG: prepilin-type N-terminal cleavage/methylation domain-containing protein [Patescibacteria group bacterium]|nr:MAG: prepilin-type N-terminal cleavage/methylation domain-containing protein [Patescibacteria group bacterium]
MLYRENKKNQENKKTPQRFEVFNSGVSNKLNNKLNSKLYNNKFFILQSNKTVKAFTLIELLVVIAIIGILSTLVIVALGNSRASARDAKRLNDLKAMANALELYYADNNAYPEADNFSPGATFEAGGVVYMSKVPNNPTPHTDGNCPDEEYRYISNSSQSYSIIACIGSNQSNLGAGGVTISSASGLQSVGSLNGLVLYLDASNPASYPGSGNTWYDLSGIVGNQTFVNGPPGFSPENGGVIDISMPQSILIGQPAELNFTPLNSFSMGGWAKVGQVDIWPGNLYNTNASFVGRGVTGGSVGIGFERNKDTSQHSVLTGSRAIAAIINYQAIQLENFYHFFYVYTPTFQYAYLNGTLYSTQNVSGSTGGSFTGNWGIFRDAALPGGNGRNIEGSIGSVKIYNRSLSHEEVLAEYNSTKNKFGL